MGLGLYILINLLHLQSSINERRSPNSMYQNTKINEYSAKFNISEVVSKDKYVFSIYTLSSIML